MHFRSSIILVGVLLFGLVPASAQKAPRSIPEERAERQLRETFEQIRKSLNTNAVPTMFQELAAYPGVLESSWSELKPVVGTEVFKHTVEKATEHTREIIRREAPFSNSQAQALLEVPVQVSNLAEFSWLSSLQGVAAVALLLGTSGSGAASSPVTLPHAGPKLRERVIEEQASPELRAVYRLVKRDLRWNDVRPEIEALGTFPEFLKVTWQSLSPVLLDNAFMGLYRQVTGSVRIEVQKWPMKIRPLSERLLQTQLTKEQKGKIDGVLREYGEFQTTFVFLYMEEALRERDKLRQAQAER